MSIKDVSATVTALPNGAWELTVSNVPGPALQKLTQAINKYYLLLGEAKPIAKKIADAVTATVK